LLIVNTSTLEKVDDNPDPELKLQCFGSGFGLELDSISSLDPFPDPDSESGTGSRGTKITHKNFSAINFLQFLVIKILDPDWNWIRIGIQPKTLDPDYNLYLIPHVGTVRYSKANLCPPELEISSWPGRRL
jgi:hypothetical protein